MKKLQKREVLHMILFFLSYLNKRCGFITPLSSNVALLEAELPELVSVGLLQPSDERAGQPAHCWRGGAGQQRGGPCAS
jgi:hypothetical protein